MLKRPFDAVLSQLEAGLGDKRAGDSKSRFIDRGAPSLEKCP
jgi:hypothetical protein